MQVCLLLLELEKFTSLLASFNEFVSQITCDESKECMYRQCEASKNNLDQYKPSSEKQQMAVKYNQWQTMDRRAEKMSITATVGDLFEELKSQTNYFLIIRYLKRKQAVHMEKLISECDGKSILLQVDFSENASCLHRMKFNQHT